jgi:hypothetical protein
MKTNSTNPVVRRYSLRQNGAWVQVSAEEYAQTRDKYSPRIKKRGLGDLVAIVAQPIAGAIDAVAGTNLKGCKGCKSRQEALNRLIPNI